MSGYRLLTVWILIVLFSLAVDVAIVYAAYRLVHSVLLWPVVRFAFGVFLAGAAWFFICDQFLEMQIKARER